MRTSFLLASLAFAAFSLPVQAQPSPAPAAAHEETELDHKMEDMNGAFRKLRRQISDASANASSLELVAKLRKASEESAALIPAKAANLPEGDRARFVAAYETKMKEFIAEVDALKAALEAGKNEEAAALLSKLNNLQKSGHREFRVQKKKE